MKTFTTKEKKLDVLAVFFYVPEYLLVLFHYSRANRVLSSLWQFIAIRFSPIEPIRRAGSKGQLLCMLIDGKMKNFERYWGAIELCTFNDGTSEAFAS
jgi:hypothetical protein